MCGIAGILDLAGRHTPSPEVVRAMTETLRHRGPDGEGFYFDGPVALGHRRLAIIDLAGGAQPMSTLDGRLTVVFNGEIYNYIELREELRSLGHHFATDSDTEVILAAYREWGDACQIRFNGMWAFALWDRDRRRLLCSRDLLGEKPLFYWEDGCRLVFGSEIKALWAAAVPRNPDLSMLDFYLAFTYVPAPYTFFRGIRKLRPGHSLVVEDGRCRTVQYWRPVLRPLGERRRDEVAICEEFAGLFDDSVRIRMRCDVPYGAFLSGGLDSSSVVASMSRFSNGPVRTFTMGFNGAGQGELPLARQVAKRFQTRHVERTVGPEDAQGLLALLTYHYDEPFGDSSALPTLLVSRFAREHVTVVLTGDGGDEILFGYTAHQGERFSQQFNRWPVWLRDTWVPRAIAMLARVPAASVRRRAFRAGRVVGAARMTFEDRLIAKGGGFPPEERASLLRGIAGIRPVRDVVDELMASCDGSEGLDRLQYWTLTVSLPDDMLCKVDRASMAVALETRIPMLDPRLVELMLSVHPDVKMPGYRRKHVLRRSLGTRLPPDLLRAGKRGFTVPLRRWFSGGATSGIESDALAAAKEGLVSADAVASLIEAESRGLRDKANAIWALAMLGRAMGPDGCGAQIQMTPDEGSFPRWAAR